jgi:hypothetical protein
MEKDNLFWTFVKRLVTDMYVNKPGPYLIAEETVSLHLASSYTWGSDPLK